MQKVHAVIEGIAPILFNRFYDASVLDAPRGQKPNEEQKKIDLLMKVYRDTSNPEDYIKQKGTIGLPGINFNKTMQYGCWSKGFKIGRKSAQPYFRATVFTEEMFVSFGIKKPDGIHETTCRVPPGPKGVRKPLCRPYLKAGWKADFHILLTDERVTFEIVKASLEEAGTISGLGDHRPEFGRFKVTTFDLV